MRGFLEYTTIRSRNEALYLLDSLCGNGSRLRSRFLLYQNYLRRFASTLPFHLAEVGKVDLFFVESMIYIDMCAF